MAAVKPRKEEPTLEAPALEAYADEQYKKLLKEKGQYISLDDYCAERGIK
jgi:hypothetical protein